VSRAATGYGDTVQLRTFPLIPRSARDLRIGDFWTVPLSDGTLGCLQVTDLKKSGSGSLKTLVAGIIDWRGSSPPSEQDLSGRRILAQGLTRIEAFTEMGSQILGTGAKTVGASALASNYRDFHVGAVHNVWGWRALAKVVDRTLRENAAS
jgi:hypothetical protein